MRRARAEELGLVGEVVVDGQPLDAGAPGDLGDGRPRRPDLLVQGGGRLDDPPPRLLLAAGAFLELVSAGRFTHLLNTVYSEFDSVPDGVTVAALQCTHRSLKGAAPWSPAPTSSAPRDGEYVHFKGLGTRHVVTAEQTGGAFAVVEHDLAPRELGAPTHTHEREDEISHVLSGRLGVQIGDEVIEAGPGDTVVKPRGIPHAFWNPGDEPVRFLEMITPAGLRAYFAELAPILDAGGPARTSRRWRGPARYALTWTWTR